MLCGSHKSEFVRPAHLFHWGGPPQPLPPGVAHVTAAAGDYVILAEATTHGVLPWQPRGRQRRVLALRFQPHDCADAGNHTMVLPLAPAPLRVAGPCPAQSPARPVPSAS